MRRQLESNSLAAIYLQQYLLLHGAALRMLQLRLPKYLPSNRTSFLQTRVTFNDA